MQKYKLFERRVEKCDRMDPVRKLFRLPEKKSLRKMLPRG